MAEKDNNISVTEIVGFLLGLMFIFSGVMKCIDASKFSYSILEYGFPSFQFMAPVFIGLEIVLGGMFVLGIYHKFNSAIGLGMLILFTILYTYAHFAKGVTNCGCFGDMDSLNNSVPFFYLKNTLFIAMLVFLYIKGTNLPARYTWMYIALVFSVGAAEFGTGQTFKMHGVQGVRHVNAVTDTPLKDFITTSSDSTYAVIVFSYTCPHCINSIANINQYEHFGIADRVIGIAMGDSVAEAKFREQTEPNFEISSVGDEALNITNRFPHFFYIKNDSIKLNFTGDLPAAYILKKYIE